MSLFKTNKKLFLITAAAVLIIAVCLGLFISLRMRYQALELKTKEKRTRLKDYQSLAEGIPSQNKIDLLQEEQSRLKQKYLSLKKELNNTEALDFPRPSLSEKPSIFFLKNLANLNRQLRNKAALCKVNIPERLGFKEEVPPEEAVPELLRQLHLAKGLVELCLEAKIDNLISIKFSPAQDEPEYRLFREFPIELVIEADTKALFDLLLLLQTPGKFFSLEKLEIISGSEKVKAALLLNNLVFGEPDENKS